MEVPSESFHRSSWDSRTCYPRRAFNQGLTDNSPDTFLFIGFSVNRGSAGSVIPLDSSRSSAVNLSFSFGTLTACLYFPITCMGEKERLTADDNLDQRHSFSYRIFCSFSYSSFLSPILSYGCNGWMHPFVPLLD